MNQPDLAIRKYESIKKSSILPIFLATGWNLGESGDFYFFLIK
jgi:hypothetical protein